MLVRAVRANQMLAAPEWAAVDAQEEAVECAVVDLVQKPAAHDIEVGGGDKRSAGRCTPIFTLIPS